MQKLSSRTAWAAPALVALALIAVTSVGARAEDAETVAVEKAFFGKAVEIKGAFVPAATHEVSVVTEAYGGALEVVEAAKAGSVVEGEPLVRFKTKAIDEQLEKDALTLELARLKFAGLEEEMTRKKEAMDIALLGEKRKIERAEEALAYFLEVDRPLRILENEHGMEGMRHRIADQKEELQQLENMYKEDDLTEETEEIVLRRARRGLERALKSMEFRERRNKRFLETTLPREQEDLELKVRNAALAWDRTQKSAERDMRKAQLDLDKARMDLDRQKEAFEKLQRDRDALTSKAPAAGTWRPGLFRGGTWSKTTDMEAALEPGNRLKVRQVFGTVLPTGPLHVRTQIEEKDLFAVRKGQPAAVAPAADKSLTLRAVVAEVGPLTGGKAEVHLRLLDHDERLVAGMACEGTIQGLPGEMALSVPARCFVEHDGKTVVYVVGSEGARPVEVEPGTTAAGRIAVVSGLKAGERVLLNPPEDGTKDE